MNDINRIVILPGEVKKGETQVFADLRKCTECNLNFSIGTVCVMCSMRIDKEKELGRRMTQEEWDKLFEWLK